MTISPGTYIKEVVRTNFKTASVFQSNNIDYCCGGNKTISEACIGAGVESEQLIYQLERIIGQMDPDTEYINNLNLTELCDFIVGRHHAYVRGNIPFLQTSIQKISRVHGTNHPELFEIEKLFNESAGELTMHMQKEEIMLFPFIKKMARIQKDALKIGNPVFGSVSNPIGMMMNEHQTEGERFDKIASLTQNYAIPADACTTYKVTLNQLKDFENDLHRHIHLENNILFPKAVELEMELTKK